MWILPIFDFRCHKCKATNEVFLHSFDSQQPECCGQTMVRLYTVGNPVIKMGYPSWVNKIDEIHKAQSDRGERLRMPHPREVGAT